MIDYYIICHDIKIINKLLKKYQQFKFLLVGNEHQNIVVNHDRIIVCSKLKYNIEQYSNLCSYTGWYATIKNKLYSGNYICLLEYDNEINTQLLYQKNIDIFLSKPYGVIGYSQTITSHPVFYRSTPWLEISLKRIHNINLYDFIYQNKDIYPQWITTTNITGHKDIFSAFIEWFDPMTKLFRTNPLGSYVHERAFFIFCVLHNIDISCITDAIKHNQLCSHNNQDIYGQFLNSKCQKHYESIFENELNSLYDTSLMDANQSLLSQKNS